MRSAAPWTAWPTSWNPSPTGSTPTPSSAIRRSRPPDGSRSTSPPRASRWGRAWRGPGTPTAILCEYDALPGLGHACGHNVIATSGAGAGAALAAVRGQLPKGRIQVIGTPAEEGGGGKMKLIEGGVFTDVDCAMMIHGLDRTILHADLLGIVRVNFDFTGKAAHASADPWQGVNALDAVIQTFNAITALRQKVRPDVRIHGIITNGGQAPNIIPEAASATFYVRAATPDSTRGV